MEGWVFSEAALGKKTLGIAFMLALFSGTTGAAGDVVRVPVFITLPDGAPEEGVQGHLVTRLVATEKGLVEDALPLSLPMRLNFASPSGQVVEAWVEAPGYWSPRRLIVGREESDPVRIPLYATGRLRARVTVPPGETLPTSLQARFEPTGVVAGKKSSKEDGAEAARMPRGVVECPIAAQGEMLCDLPAGQFDVRLRAEGYISHFRWGLKVPAGETRLVGNVPLERGGSVVAWIEAESSTPVSLKEVRARLEVVEAGGAVARRERQRLDRMALDGKVTERGFVHFPGVPPGQYRVAVERSGFGKAYSPPVTVFENVETSLRGPVVLKPEARLTLRLFPARDPSDQPWWVELYDTNLAGSSIDSRARGEASEEGAWSRGGLPQGEYRLAVQASDGSRWLFDTVLVDQTTVNREVEVEMIALDGTVTLGGDPIAARVHFGGRRGARSVSFLADEDGVFGGALPFRGESEEWVVDVVAAEPALERRLVGVTVRRGEAGRATVALDLDALRVTGELVEAGGEPVAGMVFLQSLETGLPEQRSVGADGSFTYQGLSAGRYFLQGYASGATTASERREVELSGDTAAPFVRLELAPSQTLLGQVLSTTGPVPGVRILLEPRRDGNTAAMVTAPQQTDVTGRFQANLPGGSDEVILTVAAPGYGLKILSVPPSGNVTVPVYREGGTLVLRFPGAGDPWAALRGAVLRQNGHALPSASLVRWAGLQGGGLTEAGALRIPRLEFGQYELCRRGEGHRNASCVGGFLPPEGELPLTLP
jgi:hypothetical protein